MGPSSCAEKPPGWFFGAPRNTRDEMVGLDADGNKVDTKPSTLGVEQIVEGPVQGTVLTSLRPMVWILNHTDRY